MEFENVLLNAVKENKQGCQMISMGYVSEPSMNKSQKLAASLMGGFSEIVPIEKITFGQFQFNYSYENAVNNRGEKEQGEEINFVAQPLRWGHYVEGLENKVIEHKGELYLRFYGLKNGKVENTYFVGGKPATDEQIAFIKECTERKEVKTQSEAGLTENQVIARSVKFTNILMITMGGVTLRRNKETRDKSLETA